ISTALCLALALRTTCFPYTSLFRSPPGAICGGIPLLTEFNGCLARGRSFESCIVENTRPGALRACSFDEPCRDDYVCARVNGAGACMPPYFLFQLRVDGHPI